MKRKLFIIGAGSVGGHVAQNIDTYSDKYEIAGFYDDDDNKIGTEQYGFNVLGPVSDVLELKNQAVIIGIALPKVKRKIATLLAKNRSLIFPSLIHNRAWISNDVSIGSGTVIYPNTSVNFGSKIGDFVVINMNCALGHHTQVQNFTSLAPGVNTGGHTKFGEAVDMGIGVSTVQEVTIGKNAVIGGQAMVTGDIPANSTAVGIPAKVINNKGE